MIKGLVIGFVLAVVILAGGVYCYFAEGMAPVATADPPMPFEKKFANMALNAHIEKQHIGESPVPADEVNFLAGADVYKHHCAACHGMPGQPAADYAATMFPKPPQLFRGKGVTDDPVSESYWKAANGIRLSGMPAFKAKLTDTQLWQVSQLVAHANEIPESVKKVLAPDVPASASATPLTPASPGASTKKRPIMQKETGAS
jgi:thiosulfate dehydrogenase